MKSLKIDKGFTEVQISNKYFIFIEKWIQFIVKYYTCYWIFYTSNSYKFQGSIQLVTITYHKRRATDLFFYNNKV